MIRVRVRNRVDRPGWQLVYTDPASGRPRTRSAGTTDRKKAERKAQQWEEQLNAGKYSARVTWDTFRERFEDEHLADKALWTKRAYNKALTKYEKVMGSPREVLGVTPSSLSEFKGKLSAAKKSPNTIRSYCRHIMAALAWAKEVGMISDVPRVRLPGEASESVWPLKLPEFTAMIDAIPKVHPGQAKELTRFLWLLWYLGLRLDEGRRIAWDRGDIQVDLEGGKRPQLEFRAAGHKGRRDERTPIPPDAAAWLAQTPKSERTGLVAPVFDDGKPITLDALSKWISATGAASGVKHDNGSSPTAKHIRQGFAARWAQKVRPVTLQKLMRHKSFTTTLRHYAKLTCDDVGEEMYGALAVDVAVDERQLGESICRKSANEK